MAAERLVLIVVTIIFTLFNCITIALRTLVLYFRRRPLGADDISIYLAFISSLGFALSSYISIRSGTGLIEDNERAREAIKAVYIVQQFYRCGIFLIKTSILFLYFRIAKDLRGVLYRGSQITMAVLVLHFIPTMIFTIIQCDPVARYWNHDIDGHCINLAALFYCEIPKSEAFKALTNLNTAAGVFTIVTDCIMLALPIPTLWNVHRPLSQRIGLLATFLSGGVSTIASCVRLYSINFYGESLTPLGAAPITTWSCIEISLGIVCASAPAIKPLFSGQTRKKCPNLAARITVATPLVRISARDANRPISQRPTLDDCNDNTIHHLSQRNACPTFAPTTGACDTMASSGRYSPSTEKLGRQQIMVTTSISISSETEGRSLSF